MYGYLHITRLGKVTFIATSCQKSLAILKLSEIYGVMIICVKTRSALGSLWSPKADKFEVLLKNLATSRVSKTVEVKASLEFYELWHLCHS
ncbi:hypothetical protein BH18ACI4_BH18ACI4_21890 [soil metagenome]